MFCAMTPAICHDPITSYCAFLKRGTKIMKRLLVVVTLLLAQPASAATISVLSEGTSKEPTLILIKGQFDSDNDRNLFSAYAADAVARKTGAIVFLDSIGGAIWTGMSIGRIIRRNGFLTAVSNHTKCVSACALAWLGGKERFIGPTDAHVGFHAAKKRDTAEISPEGNALVGAYLYEIGITDPKTITFLTKPLPPAMAWLTTTDANRHG